MIVCKQCGVELDEQMQVCPLCDTSVMDGRKFVKDFGMSDPKDGKAKPALLKRVLWQITCVLLLSGIVATLIINFARAGYVSWSIYPVTICLILFSYFSVMALWRTRLDVQLVTGWIASDIVLIGVALYTGDDWPNRLVLPILCAVTIIAILLKTILSKLKVKGLNMLAIMLVAIALLCIFIESTLSLFFKHEIVLEWSVIVLACLLPVIATVIFIHVRTKNNKDLQKIFHT